jgi:hypothetical protein
VAFSQKIRGSDAALLQIDLAAFRFVTRQFVAVVGINLTDNILCVQFVSGIDSTQRIRKRKEREGMENVRKFLVAATLVRQEL